MKKSQKLFIYIGIGIVLLVVLLYFKSLTNTIEHNKSNDLLIPLTTTDTVQKKHSVKIKIDKDLKVFVDDVEYDIEVIEAVLIKKVVNDSLTIILNAEKSVPVKHIIDIMDMANQNKFKVILATNSED